MAPAVFGAGSAPPIPAPATSPRHRHPPPYPPSGPFPNQTRDPPGLRDPTGTRGRGGQGAAVQDIGEDVQDAVEDEALLEAGEDV